MITRPVAIAVGVALLLAGLRGAHADSTTRCEVDSWGDVKCTTTSSDPSPYSGGKVSTLGGLAGLTVIAALVASLYAGRSDTTDPARDDEIALGIMVGVEMLPNPLLVYFDGAAMEPEVKEQWKTKTTVIAELWGTAIRDAGKSTAPALGGRVTVGRGRIGVDAAGEAATDPKRHSIVSGHLLLRAPARHRATIALAVGASRIAFGGQVRTGLDISIPHAYIISHDDKTGAADVVIMSRPGLFSGGNGIDVRLDLALVVPVAPKLAVEIGGGVFSFDSQISVKGSAGLALAL